MVSEATGVQRENGATKEAKREVAEEDEAAAYGAGGT